jgi:hypothetical protein
MNVTKAAAVLAVREAPVPALDLLISRSLATAI